MNDILIYLLFNTNLYDKMYFPSDYLKQLQKGKCFNKYDYQLCKKYVDNNFENKLRLELQNSVNKHSKSQNNKRSIYTKDILIFDDIMILMNLKYKQINSLNLPDDVLNIIKYYLDL